MYSFQQVTAAETRHAGHPDTKPSGAGMDVISAILEQVTKLQSELNDVKEQHRTDIETISQQHKTDMETMQQVLDDVKEKHGVEMNMIREELKIVKQNQEINKKTEKQYPNYETNKIIKQNEKIGDNPETESLYSTENFDDDDITSGSVNTERQTGLSGRQSVLTGNKAGPRTRIHHRPSELEEIIISGVDNGTDLNKIQGHIGGSNQGNVWFPCILRFSFVNYVTSWKY